MTRDFTNWRQRIHENMEIILTFFPLFEDKLGIKHEKDKECITNNWCN